MNIKFKIALFSIIFANFSFSKEVTIDSSNKIDQSNIEVIEKNNFEKIADHIENSRIKKYIFPAVTTFLPLSANLIRLIEDKFIFKAYTFPKDSEEEYYNLLNKYIFIYLLKKYTEFFYDKKIKSQKKENRVDNEFYGVGSSLISILSFYKFMPENKGFFKSIYYLDNLSDLYIRLVRLVKELRR